ncbi:hypothetical protein NG798_26965 [Ancylothrix sp. C2]|nr:hypothetical protein [Ancylothrix sp. D3o]
MSIVALAFERYLFFDYNTQLPLISLYEDALCSIDTKGWVISLVGELRSERLNEFKKFKPKNSERKTSILIDKIANSTPL